MPTISVVIPSRNDAVMLQSCLAALARQSRPADQIIVVDNGSTDNTADICAAAGVTRIEHSLPGIAGTSAAGFDAACSDILARLDADSRPPEDWLARIETILGPAGPLTLVTGPGDFYGHNRLVCWLGRVLYLGGYFHVVGFLLGHPPVFGSNFAMRATVWEQLRGTLNRGPAGVHDDLDISYHLRPGMTVIFDKNLRMPVSARPFRSWGSLGKRLVMSYTTFRLEFAQEQPFKRRRARKRWARAAGR